MSVFVLRNDTSKSNVLATCQSVLPLERPELRLVPFVEVLRSSRACLGTAGISFQAA